jgi:PAS domain S-box-containing protein
MIRGRRRSVVPLASEDAELLRELLESAPDALVIVDHEGRIVFVNQQTEMLFGYAADELVAEDVEILLPEALRTAHRSHRDGYLDAPALRPMGVGLELHGRRKDGSVFPVDISLGPLHRAEGLLVAARIRDIGERKLVEEELQRSEALLRGLLESAPDAIVIVDRDARIVFVNGQAERLFGYSREELVGNAVELLLPERVRDRHVYHRTGYIAEPTARPMGAGLELLARRKDGTEFPVDVSLSPHETPDGLLVMSAIRDVTEQKRGAWEMRRFAVEAERANAAKSEFLSRMSHELRTPLNSILGFAQVLELDDLTADQRANVGYIIRAGRHLLSLINEVLDMAQIEAGRLELSVEPVSVEHAVSEAIELVQPLADERGVAVGADPPARPIFVLADQQRLLQVLINLIGNAVKYSPSGAEARVAWTTRGDRAIIEVRDSGPGVPADELDRIFAPFERLDAASRTEGTGLGLSLARNLAEAMGGTVTVTSTPGEGSVFTVELPPAASDRVVKTPYSPLPSGASATRTVLHIEDNLVGQRLVERIMRRLPGVEVMSAAEGALGVDLARRYRPDAILLDLHLSDIGGEEVMRRLLSDAATRDIPVIVVSADTSRDVADRMTRDGARAFLTKPIDADVLLTVVDELTRPSSQA